MLQATSINNKNKGVHFNTNGTNHLIYSICFDVGCYLESECTSDCYSFYAVPLSLLEAFIGSYICIKISHNN
jgi:hypothetical protein